MRISIWDKIQPYRSNPMILGYITPMLVFMVITNIEAYTPHSLYVWIYGIKVIVVTGLLIFFRQPWIELKWARQYWWLTTIVGVMVFGLWVGIENLISYPHIGQRVEFNPFETLNELQRPIFFVLRFFGLVLMVPVMEEIFWRSFLLRYIKDADFRALKMGDASLASFSVVAVGFGLFHSEWLTAIISAILYGGLMIRTKSLGNCILSHGLTNFLLGLYVLFTQDWKFW